MSLIEGIDYYVDKQSGLMVLTAFFHEKRGYCCGNKCKECCFLPIHTKGSTLINVEKKFNNTQQ